MALSSPSDGNLQDNAMLVLVFLSRKAIKLSMVFAVAIWRGCRLRTLIVVWEAPYLRCGLIHSIIVFHVNFHLDHMIEFLKTSSCKHEHLRHIHYRQKLTVRERSALYYLWGLFSSHCSRSFCEHAAHHRSLENLETNLLWTTESIQFAFRTTISFSLIAEGH